MTKEINELSKKTLNSYIDKNTNDETGAISTTSDMKKVDKKIDNRNKGFHLANKKTLTKEDFLPLLHAATSKSAVDFRDVFETLITAKISDLVEGYKEEIASTLLKEVSTTTIENK